MTLDHSFMIAQYFMVWSDHYLFRHFPIDKKFSFFQLLATPDKTETNRRALVNRIHLSYAINS